VLPVWASYPVRPAGDSLGSHHEGRDAIAMLRKGGRELETEAHEPREFLPDARGVVTKAPTALSVFAGLRRRARQRGLPF
jgi:hypothetical protein